MRGQYGGIFPPDFMKKSSYSGMEGEYNEGVDWNPVV